MEIQTRCKDPNSRVDFKFDWTSHFTDGDKIVSAEIVPFDGLTVEEPIVSNNIVTVWCSGGNLGDRKLLTCRVHTVSGRIEDASVMIKIKEL